MTLKTTVTIVLLAASLAACASAEVWSKRGATDQEVSADTAACRDAAGRSGGGAITGQLNGYNYFQRCMADHGYLVSLF